MRRKVGVSEGGDNERNLWNLSISKKSTQAGYLIFKGTKKGVDNTKKDDNAARGSDYLISGTKKIFNLLQDAFTQASIFQHFDPERHIRIETNASGYIGGRVLFELFEMIWANDP